jgi:hypothetical protein
LAGVVTGDNVPLVRQRIKAAQELLRDSQKLSSKEQQHPDSPQAEKLQAD